MDNPFSCLASEGEYYRKILDRIRYREEWEKILFLDGNRWYFQWGWKTTCNFTGKPMISRSAKYYLSPHMTQTEVVNKVFLATLKAEEHEIRERFLYRPSPDHMYRAPYNTHTDIDELYEAATASDIR